MLFDTYSLWLFIRIWNRFHLSLHFLLILSLQWYLRSKNFLSSWLTYHCSTIFYTNNSVLTNLSYTSSLLALNASTRLIISRILRSSSSALAHFRIWAAFPCFSASSRDIWYEMI